VLDDHCNALEGGEHPGVRGRQAERGDETIAAVTTVSGRLRCWRISVPDQSVFIEQENAFKESNPQADA
jgi:hypothetical protein